MIVSDHIYWACHAFGMAREDSSGPTVWFRRFELDRKRGWLTACCVCRTLYPMPESPALNRLTQRALPWTHVRNWKGPAHIGIKGQGLTGCLCLPCSTRIINDLPFYDETTTAQLVAAQLEDRSESPQA